MASIFAHNDAPCGVFAILEGQNTIRSIDFTRGVRSQNSAGEIVTVYLPVATLTVNAQPTGGQVLREIHGEVAQISYRLFATGITVLREFDRFYIDGTKQLEIINVMQYGDSHAEVEARYIGR